MPTLSFKVSPEEATRIRRLARAEKRSLSAYLRRHAMQESAAAASGDAGYRIIQSPLTGLPVMEAPAGTPPVTSEQVRALLTDFP